MDITQIVIVVSLLVITGAISFCTYYFISLIKEIQAATSKVTQILDDTHQITGSIARPVSSFSEFLMGFQNGFKIFNNFFNKEEKTKK